MIRLNCTNCGYTLEKVQVNESELSCPGCRHQLDMDETQDTGSVKDEEAFFNEVASGASIDQFYVLDETEEQVKPQAVEEDEYLHPEQSVSTETNSDNSHCRLEFQGSASEFFRIWIVNTFLTFLTLGVYEAWARVRNRQYLVKNTVVNGSPFSYQENPVSILKINMIIGAGVITCFLSELLNTGYTPAFVVICCVMLPFLIHKRFSFYVNSTSYQNVRFRFIGSLADSYDMYLLFPMLVPVSLGLMFPCWTYFRKKYLLGNIVYGETKNDFKGRPVSFYLMYVPAILFCALITFLAFVVINNYSLVRDMIDAGNLELGYESLFTFPALAGLIIIVVLTYLQQNIYAQITNYCLEHSRLGTLGFMGTVRGGDLFWIRCTNVLAVIFSAGLLIPWARIRRMRYLLNNITLVSDRNFEDHLISAKTAGMLNQKR